MVEFGVEVFGVGVLVVLILGLALGWGDRLYSPGVSVPPVV